MSDEYNYPTDEELHKIATWDVDDPDGWWDFIYSHWWSPWWGWREGLDLILISTGGWSGNEDIIDHMRQNQLWERYYIDDRQGGHYRFRPVLME